MIRKAFGAICALTIALALAGCNLIRPEVQQPTQEEIVGRWVFSAEESDWHAPGAYMDFSGDGTYSASLPEFEEDAETTPSGELVLHDEVGTWEIVEGVIESHDWTLVYDGSCICFLEIGGGVGDRSLSTSAGSVESPRQFMLRKVDRVD